MESVMNLQKFDNVYDDFYFNINKTLQIITGLWPYRTRANNAPQRLIVYTFLFAMMLPQINGARLMYGRDADTFIENIAGIIYVSAVFMKYWTTAFCEKDILKVYNKVANNWMMITDPEERLIMIDYAKQGRFKTIGYIAYMFIATTGFCMFPMSPIFLDMISPLNQSRQKLMIIKGEFFIDQEKYYYHLCFYAFFCSIASVVVFISIDTTYTIVVHQNLAIFTIVKHRLQISTANYNPKNDNSYKMLTRAIDLHKDALQFIELIDSSYSLCFLMLIGLSILIISVTAIVLMNTKTLFDVARFVLFEVGLMIHLFYITWPGQKVMDHTSDLFVYVYCNEWYNVTEKGKTLLKFMMLKCLKPSILSAGGLYIMNFENYGAVLKSAMSYITVFSSIKE